MARPEAKLRELKPNELRHEPGARSDEADILIVGITYVWHWGEPGRQQVARIIAAKCEEPQAVQQQRSRRARAAAEV